MDKETNDNEYRRQSEHRTSAPKRKKKKKVRKLPIILLIVVISLIALVVYIVHSYNSGVEYAKKRAKGVEVYQFNGSVKNDSKISILVLGADEAQGGQSRTDPIMAVQYDFTNKKMRVMSVMRDIYVDIPGYGKHKANSAYALGGPELLRRTLDKNLGINPEYYVVVDFIEFGKTTDELMSEGVPINVEKDMSKNIGVSLKKGNRGLNGKELLGYAGSRRDSEGDFGRMQRQQQAMQTLEKEMVNFRTVVKLPKVVGISRSYTNTNTPDSGIFQTGLNFGIRDKKDAKSLVVPIKNSYEDININTDGGVLQINKNTNKRAIKDFLNED